MRITAVSGWAIATEWFSEQIQKYFIDSEINVIYPSNPFDTEEARRQLYEKPADLYLGYSLGSLWMFRHRELFPKKSIKAVLAPILAFTKEHDMGGRTTSTQLNYLIKLLKKDIIVGAVRPPTVPQGSSRIRLSLNSELSKEILEPLISIVKEWSKK